MRRRDGRRDRRRDMRIGGAVALAAVTAALAGCGGMQVFGIGETQACASWVEYLTDEQMAEDADVVAVVGEVRPDGTEKLMGFDMNAYAVTVEKAVAGEVDAGEELRVVSTADTCAAQPYGEGDPMLTGGTLTLYLTEDGEVLRTLTPFAGVVVADD
ncbi:hypothetical protein N3K63_10710 [Microbacterium sp. W1N]|uniref:hypothetical protein n=1 Tax=Microbacterium festucae TaxID=2977531 RepID=UPI0021C1D9E8|nr:hypothetical protein [Microbacterium festucae]MCT9820753.1 hypothetical protein [Microbacterium festucae]